MSSSIRSARALSLASLAVLSWLGISACAKKEQARTDTSGASAAAATPPPPAPAPTVNDAQIAHIVVTANSIDSTAGVTARKSGASKAVKDFAQTMITDHSSLNKQSVALAKKLNVTPEDNDISKQLKSGADQSQSNLQNMKGAGFDSAYINHEVEYHQAVLDALDKTLIPGAQNADLKALLEKARPVVAAHLDRAKSIQGSLGKK